MPGGTVLVVGATGTVGAKLVQELLARDVRVRGGSRDPAAAAARVPAARREGGRLTWVRLDLERPDTFAPALEGVEGVFMVARPGDDDADRLAAPLVDALGRAGVERVVDLSAMGAEAREDFALRRIERMLEASGPGWTHLRPNWFMEVFGSGSLLAGIRAGELRLPAGEARISYIAAGDVAAVAAVALTEPAHTGRAYTLTGGAALHHAQVAERIAEASGRTLRYRALDEGETRAALTASGLGPARVERLIGFYRLVRAGACAPVTPDVPAILGRAPVSFEDFARAQADLWRPAGDPARHPAAAGE